MPAGSPKASPSGGPVQSAVLLATADTGRGRRPHREAAASTRSVRCSWPGSSVSMATRFRSPRSTGSSCAAGSTGSVISPPMGRTSATDDHSRLTYTEELADERGATAAGFWQRAVKWFRRHGIRRIRRVLTDNGSCYRSWAFAAALAGSKTRHKRTRPTVRRRTGRSSGITAPWPPSGSTPAPGPATSNAGKRYTHGSSTTTTIDRTAHSEAGHPSAAPPDQLSPTSLHRTTRARGVRGHDDLRVALQGGAPGARTVAAASWIAPSPSWTR